ncbi:MAG: hypothetical protein AABX93_03450 [Nanoarchaeota archaeon]
MERYQARIMGHYIKGGRRENYNEIVYFTSTDARKEQDAQRAKNDISKKLINSNLRVQSVSLSKESTSPEKV